MNLEQLYRQAQAALDEKRFPEARELGHQLLKLRFSGAFEILAKAFMGEGKPDIAIRVLENGVAEAPQVWSLWLQLGNCRSQLRDLVGAMEAYNQARNLPGSDHDQINFNEAFMRLQFGNKERALEMFGDLVKATEDKKLRLVSLSHRLTTLIELDRVTEAMMELGEAYLHDADNAELLTNLSHKLLEVGDEGNAINLAMQALGLKRSGRAAQVVRLIRGEESSEACLFNVVLRGKVEDEDGKWHYFTKHSKVYADNGEEAEELAKAFEPPDVRPSLSLESVEKLSEPAMEKKGVDWSGPLEMDD